MGRTKFRLCETGVDAVVIAVGALGRQPLADAEQRIEHVIEPDAGRRAAKQMAMRSEPMPDRAQPPRSVRHRGEERRDPRAERLRSEERRVGKECRSRWSG